MKKFKFRLEALLKVRKLKENQCKMEIGRLQVEVSELKNQINFHQSAISQAYEAQEEVLNEGTTGQEISFYPYMFQGNQASISILEEKINVLTAKIDELYFELGQLRASVKVVENMKDNDFNKYKKLRNKKEQEIIEEQVKNWKQILG